MPWTKLSQARGHTKKADDPDKQKVWLKVANDVRAKTMDDARAIREADAVVGRIRRVRGKRKAAPAA